MKWDYVDSKTKFKQYIETKSKQHKWFAWYPVVIEDKWVWLEFVYRKRQYLGSWGWDTATEHWTTEYSLTKDES